MFRSSFNNNSIAGIKFVKGFKDSKHFMGMDRKKMCTKEEEEESAELQEKL